jgi:hypothetical protein
LNSRDLVKARIICPCNCKICQLFKEANLEAIVYQILGSKYRVRKLCGKVSFWFGCPRSIESIPSSFEELFDSIDDDGREKIIYHLNSFRASDG